MGAGSLAPQHLLQLSPQGFDRERLSQQLDAGIESESAGHSTIFASFARHCAPNTADPSAVIRSTTCAGGTNGAISSGGASNGGIGGGIETVGLTYVFAGIFMSP